MALDLRRIAAAVNAFPELIARVRELEARVELAERVAEALSASMSRPHGPMGGLAEHMSLRRAVKDYEQARAARGKGGG